MNERPGTPRARLKHRMMAAFAAFTLLVTGVFGVLAVLFAYEVEDQFIAGLLAREAQRQAEQWRMHGAWARPRHDWMQVIDTELDLPDGVADLLREEPRRVEFPGLDGRHFHLVALPADTDRPRAWVVGEVSDLLVIRPHREAWLKLLAGTGLTMVALALALGLALAHRTTAALSRLAAQIDATTPEQLPPDLARQCGPDEVGVLARALDALVGRVRDLVEREREFSRDAGHELRTPLAVIRTACERMAHEPGTTPAMRTSLRHIQQSAAQLEQTVGILMLLAREERVPQVAEPTRLLPLVERVVVEQAILIEDRPIEVSVSVAPELSTRLPVPVLNMLLANLIGNAFAHTQEGCVLIEAEPEQLRVSNPGAKLPPDAFRTFAKGEASAGMGLGLSIIKRLCERYALALHIEAAEGVVRVSLGLRPGSALPPS